VWADEIEGARVDLRGWLAKVMGESATWALHRAEWGFGVPRDEGADPESTPEPARLFDRFLVRGRIDSIERHRESGAFRVTDLKTGTDETRPFLVIGGGETLQPALYALALESAAPREVAEGRLFFCTTKGGFSEHVVTLDDEARRRAREVLEIIDRAIERGFLAPLPREGACARCAYQAVCGPEADVRAARKDHRRSGDPGVIQDLFELRARR
jgi:hypothetical protein